MVSLVSYKGPFQTLVLPKIPSEYFPTLRFCVCFSWGLRKSFCFPQYEKKNPTSLMYEAEKLLLSGCSPAHAGPCRFSSSRRTGPILQYLYPVWVQDHAKMYA